MAEILGAVASGLTVAGLIKLCLEAFDIIKVARNQGLDYEKLSLRLNIERARLFTWSEAIGLTNPDLDGTTKLLRESPFQSLVRDTLKLIISLFQDGDKLRDNYGCAIYTEKVNRKRLSQGVNENSSNSVHHLAMFFSGFRIHEKRPIKMSVVTNKTKWVIKDRQKFAELVQEVRMLIDGLQDITKSLSTAARQEGMMRYNIQQIKDTETLSLVSEVCQQDYPDVSDAASIKVDVLTIAGDKSEAIKEWASSIERGIDIAYEDGLEQLTITELQAIVRQSKSRGNPFPHSINDQRAASQPSNSGTPSTYTYEDLNEIVLEFLSKRGYHETMSILRHETSIQKEMGALEPADNQKEENTAQKRNKRAKTSRRASRLPKPRDSLSRPIDKFELATHSESDAHHQNVNKEVD